MLSLLLLLLFMSIEQSECGSMSMSVAVLREFTHKTHTLKCNTSYKENTVFSLSKERVCVWERGKGISFLLSFEFYNGKNLFSMNESDCMCRCRCVCVCVIWFPAFYDTIHFQLSLHKPFVPLQTNDVLPLSFSQGWHTVVPIDTNLVNNSKSQ